MPSDPNMIVASSSAHASDTALWVHLLWGEERAQLTPNDARQFALSVLVVAEAAEHDALLVSYLTRPIGPGFCVGGRRRALQSLLARGLQDNVVEGNAKRKQVGSSAGCGGRTAATDHNARESRG
jgi:hypothetical protein